MSSSVDAGYYASEAAEEKGTECPKGGEHDWKVHSKGSPS